MNNQTWNVQSFSQVINFLVDIVDTFQGLNKNFYRGWMISSSPEVTPLEHPIYDLWLIGCINDNTS